MQLNTPSVCTTQDCSFCITRFLSPFPLFGLRSPTHASTRKQHSHSQSHSQSHSKLHLQSRSQSHSHSQLHSCSQSQSHSHSQLIHTHNHNHIHAHTHNHLKGRGGGGRPWEGMKRHPESWHSAPQEGISYAFSEGQSGRLSEKVHFCVCLFPSHKERPRDNLFLRVLCLSISSSLYSFIYLHLFFIYLSVRLFIHLSICLSLYS